MSAAGINSEFMARAKEQGFTLLEILLVVLVIALALAVTYRPLSRGSAMLNLRASSRDVLNIFRYAREKAVTEQTGMIVTVDKNNQQLTLSNNLGDDAKTYTMPKNITINRIALSGNIVEDGSITVRFLPNGSADEAEVLLGSTYSNSQLNIISDPLAGGGRIESVQGTN